MYVTLPLYHATGIVVCWCGVIAGSATLAIRRKYSTSAFWKDVQKFNASAIGYVGELCRYLMDAPPSEIDRAHRVTKMIGNGMRPNIWDKFKQRFGVKEVLELYASVKAMSALAIFSTLTILLASLLLLMQLCNMTKKKEAIRDQKVTALKSKQAKWACSLVKLLAAPL
jgi:citronellyl-CoA synthetase